MPCQDFIGAASQRALASACRRAMLYRREAIGTEHLLMGVFDQIGESDTASRALSSAMMGRLAGSPEAAPDPAVEVPELADMEVDGALREARWRASRLPSRKAPPSPVWHPRVRPALWRAISGHDGANGRCVALRDLAEAVLADRDSGASELVRSAGLRADGLVADVSERHPQWSTDGPPDEIAGRLKAFRVLDMRVKAGPSATAVSRSSVAILRRTRMDLVMIALEMEAIRQAVRLGAQQVHTGHLLLATIELDSNLVAVGARLPEALVAVNSAGSVLAVNGVDRRRAGRLIAELPVTMEPAVMPLRGPWWWKPGQRRWWRTNPRNPTWAVSAGNACDTAQSEATRAGVPAGSSQLLTAVLADPHGPASRVLREMAVDPAAVATEIARRLPG